MEAHVEQATADLQREGLSPREARAEARARFGSMETHLSEARRVRRRSERRERRSERLAGLAHDVRFAWRALRARPAFACAAAALLGAGIAGTTVMSSLVESILLRPLPFGAPDRLVLLDGVLMTSESVGPFPSADEQMDWRPRIRGAFADVAAYFPESYSVNVSGTGPATEAGLTEVTGNFFEVLRQRVLLGRTFVAAEVTGPADAKPVVIGERLWRTHLEGDRDALGREILIDGRSHYIVGVIPGAAQLPAAVDLWVPMGESWDDSFVHGARYFHYVARLRPGITAESARPALADLAAHFAARRDNWEEPVTYRPLHDAVVGNAGGPLWLLLGGISLLLLIALVNLASYLLARSRTRQVEYTVRAALGAARRRLVQQSLAESAILTGGGLVVASLGSAWVVGLVRASDLPLPRLDSLVVDWRLFVLALGVSLMCALAFGLGPAIVASRPDLSAGIAGGAGGTTGSRRRLHVLVVAQVAIAVVLASGAGLLVRSHERLRDVDNGFGTEVLTFAARLDDGSFADGAEARGFAATLVDRLQALPGVDAAGASTLLPLAPRNNFGLRYRVEGRPEPSLDRAFAFFSAVTSGFLEALEVPLVAGRAFDSRDTDESARVAVVNRAFVRAHLDSDDSTAAVGSVVIEGSGERATRWEIVGVVDDLRRRGPAAPPVQEVWFPLAQRTQRPEFYAVRTTADPASVVAAARTIVNEMAPSVPIHDVGLMGERLHDNLTEPRLLAALFTGFGVASVLLASFGLYAVVSQWVAARRREIGVCMAIGATRGRVFARVLRDAGARLAVGVVVGIAIYSVLARSIDARLLFDTGIYEIGTLGAVVAAVVGATLMGAAGAAARIVRLDPVRALRGD